MLGFLFIGGWGNTKKTLVGSVGLHTCPVCHQLTRWDVYKIDKRATVYFVPVYTYSSEKVVICSNCHNGAQMSELEIATLRSQGQTTAPAPAPAPAAPPSPRRQPPGMQPAAAGFRTGAASAPLPPAPPRTVPPPPAATAGAPAAQPRPAQPVNQTPANPPVAAGPPRHVPMPPPGTDRRLADWLRSLQTIVLKYGWVTEDVRWGEEPYGVPSRLIATFVQNGTSYVISVHKKADQAQRYAGALEADPAVRQATQAGTHLMRVIERRVLRVHDARGVDTGQLETWAKTVGWYPLPN